MRIWTVCERCGGMEQVIYELPGRSWRVPCPACNSTGAVVTTVAESGQLPHYMGGKG